MVGTSSLRRKALALRARPDLTVVDLRGNVETRLRKLDEGEAEATMLALAGLGRLGLADRATSLIDAGRLAAGGRPGRIAIVARDRRRGDARRGSRRSTIATRRWRLPPSAPSSPCSTAPAGRRSAASREIGGGDVCFRGIIVKPDGSGA